MSDQKVTLQVDAKPLSGLDKPFKDMAEGAKEAEGAVKKLNAEAEKSKGKGGLAGGAAPAIGGGGGFSPFKGATAGVGGMVAGLDAVNSTVKDLGNVLGAIGGDFDLVKMRSGTIGELTFQATRGIARFADSVLGIDINGWGSLFKAAAKVGRTLEQLNVSMQVGQAALNQNFNPERRGLQGELAGLTAEQAFRDANPLSGVGGDRHGIGLAFRAQDTGAQLAGIGARKGGLQDDITRLQEGLRRIDTSVTPLGSFEDERKVGPEGAATLRRQAQIDVANQLNQAQTQLVALEKQERDLLKDSTRESVLRLGMTKQQTDEQLKQANAAVLAERAKAQGSQAEYGLADPFAQKQALSVAKKFAGGGNLNPMDLDIAKQFSFFKDALQDYGAKKGDTSNFREIQDLLGLNKGVKAAEESAAALSKISVDVQSKIEAELKVGEQGLANQLANQLAPKIQQQIDLLTEKLGREFEQKLDLLNKNRLVLAAN